MMQKDLSGMWTAVRSSDTAGVRAQLAAGATLDEADSEGCSNPLLLDAMYRFSIPPIHDVSCRVAAVGTRRNMHTHGTNDHRAQHACTRKFFEASLAHYFVEGHGTAFLQQRSACIRCSFVGLSPGRTPLMVACAAGDTEMVFLLVNGVSPPSSVAARQVKCSAIHG